MIIERLCDDKIDETNEKMLLLKEDSKRLREKVRKAERE